MTDIIAYPPPKVNKPILKNIKKTSIIALNFFIVIIISHGAEFGNGLTLTAGFYIIELWQTPI